MQKFKTEDDTIKMSRYGEGMSPSGSVSSLSGSFSPRDSPGPLSPGGASLGDRKKGGGGIQMQIQQLQGR